MEATAVYWIPVFVVPECEGFEVDPADARAAKQVSGCKSDVLACRWIRASRSVQTDSVSDASVISFRREALLPVERVLAT